MRRSESGRRCGASAAASLMHVTRGTQRGGPATSYTRARRSASGLRYPVLVASRQPPTSTRMTAADLPSTSEAPTHLACTTSPASDPCSTGDRARRGTPSCVRLGPRVERFHQDLEVVREPEVVVAEIRDDRTAGAPQSLVVGPGLVPGVLGQVDPLHARVPDRSDRRAPSRRCIRRPRRGARSPGTSGRARCRSSTRAPRHSCTWG